MYNNINMPKINAYSRSNNFDTAGLIDILNAYTDQPVLKTSDVVFNSIEIDTIFSSGDVVVGGDLTVNGQTTIISSEILEIVDNIILINSAQNSPGVSLNLAGVEVDRGDLINFQSVYEESSLSFKIGQVDDLQTVATREDNPLDKGILVFNDLEKRLDSVNDIQLPIVFSSGVNSTDSSSGSIVISNGGGIGVSGDIYTDDTIFIKGDTYSSFIKSNNSDDIIVNSGSNFIFQQDANTRVQIPSNVNLIFASLNKRIFTDGTDLHVENLGGEIKLATSGNIRINNNKYIQWDNGNLIGYNGTNMILNSTGNFTVSPLMIASLSTSSTSPTTGGLLSFGGVGIVNSTDAVDENNGGSITSAGGLAIKKKIFSGQEITSNSGENSNHFRLFSNNLGRFSLGLDGVETGTNSGSNFVIKNYDDSGNFISDTVNIERQSGDISILSTTPSISSTEGSIMLSGGISIQNTTNSLSFTNGGSFTTAGGASVAKDLYIGQNLIVTNSLFIDGISNLNQTNIDTTEGSFVVSGTNSVFITVDNSSSFSTTSGSLTLESENGTLLLIGEMGINLESNSGIAMVGSGDSNFTTTSGKISIISEGVLVNGNAGDIEIDSLALIEMNSGNGGTTIDTTDTTDGIKIGTKISSIPISIGHTSSEVIVNDNLTIGGDLTILGTTTSINSTVVDIADNALIVNSLPTGLSDGGYLIKRFQSPNNNLLGEVVKDTPLETGNFQNGSTATNIVLDIASSNVNNFYNGMWIAITSGSGQNQVRRIKSYDNNTNIAEIYGDSDNTVSFTDGLDLAAIPSDGDSYSIYNTSFSSIFYSETNKEFRIAYIPLNTSSGEFPETQDYISIHAGGLILEEAFTSNSSVLIDNTDTEAFLIRKSNDSGDVFQINTVDHIMSLENPSNVINTDVNLQFKQLDSVNSKRVYSEIISTLRNNIAGNLKSDLEFKVQNDTEGLTTFLKLSGDISGNSFVDISSSVDSLRILNNTNSQSSTTGAVICNGGVSISNTTDAVSSINGGSLTSSGGAAISKKLFVGTDLTVEGEINAGVSSETLTISNTDNIDGVVTVLNSKLISNTGEKSLSSVLRFNCLNSDIHSSMEMSVPGINSFTNIYDVTGVVSGYANDSSPISLENTLVYCISGSDRVKISFTSSSNLNIHTLNIILRYSV